MSIWLYERTIENLHIELERFRQMSFEKQDDFQRATRRGDLQEARRFRKEQLLIDEKIRLLTRELILIQKKLQELKTKRNL